MSFDKTQITTCERRGVTNLDLNLDFKRKDNDDLCITRRSRAFVFQVERIISNFI